MSLLDHDHGPRDQISHPLDGFGFVVPIPMHLRIPVLLVADQQQDLYAVESGRVIALADSGAMVEPGDVLIEMANDELEDQLQQFAAELAVAETIVQANQSRKGTDQASSSALALAVKVRDSAEKNWQQARARVQRLTVRSPMSGRFTQRVPHPTEIRDRRFHVGHWVPAGTTVGWVGHPQERFGYAMATQGQIDRIQRGQRVRVCHQSLPTEYLFGRVQQVERTAWQTIPSELSAENLIIDEQSPNRVAKRTEAKYLVRIDLEPVGAVELPLRLVAIAEISVEPTSLWNRLRRLVADEYRGL